MRQKIKALKKDMDRYTPYLYKKHPISKLILKQIELILSKDMEEELMGSWYFSMGIFISDIRWEIKKMDKEFFSLNNIEKLKADMDKYYHQLYDRLGEFFVMLYRFLDCILLEDDLSDQLMESYKNIYDSVEIIKEEIERIERDK